MAIPLGQLLGGRSPRRVRLQEADEIFVPDGRPQIRCHVVECHVGVVDDDRAPAQLHPLGHSSLVPFVRPGQAPAIVSVFVCVRIDEVLVGGEDVIGVVAVLCGIDYSPGQMGFSAARCASHANQEAISLFDRSHDERQLVDVAV